MAANVSKIPYFIVRAFASLRNWLSAMMCDVLKSVVSNAFWHRNMFEE